MSKYVITIILCLSGFMASAQQETRQLIFGLGPSFETTWSFADEAVANGDYFKTGVSENIGLRLLAQYNIKKFGVQGYAQLKRVSVKYVHDGLTEADQQLFKNFRATAYQNGLGMEAGIYGGGNFALGKHQLYVALGAGVVYNHFNGYGGGGSFNSIVVQPDSGGIFMDHNINNTDELVYSSVTPLANMQVSFRQQLKNPKLGIMYVLENKWGLTPTMNETFNYNAELRVNNQSSSYHASFSNVRTMNLTFSVLMTFEAGKGKGG